jgi:hypothetical protein
MTLSNENTVVSMSGLGPGKDYFLYSKYFPLLIRGYICSYCAPRRFTL